jgi:flagellar assembly factor FliW
MQMESTRFGNVEVRDDAVLTFPDCLPGLADRQWALLAASEDSPFYWLHSLESPHLAVPVTNPWQFFGDYEVRVPDDDAGRLGLERTDDALILCVVKAAERLADFTINLAGPLIVHKQTLVARQIINDVGRYAVRHPLFAEVELNDVLPAQPEMAVQAAAI